MKQSRRESPLISTILSHHDFIGKSQCFRVSWQEADSPIDADKCNKIVVHVFRITPSGNETQLMVMKVFITSGTIQIQGNLCMKRAKSEFKLMLDLVNQSNNKDRISHFCNSNDYELEH